MEKRSDAMLTPDSADIHGKLAASGLRPKCFEQIVESGVNIASDLFSMDGEAPYASGKGKRRIERCVSQLA